MTKLLLVVANYYPDISKKLLDSSLLAVNKKSSSNTLHDYDVSVINAPGVFEIPVTKAKNINNFDAFIALGCVIKGDTPHFELISRAFTDGIMKLSIEHPIQAGISLRGFNHDFWYWNRYCKNFQNRKNEITR